MGFPTKWEKIKNKKIYENRVKIIKEDKEHQAGYVLQRKVSCLFA